jgi:uncharacterized protein (DUF1919 family)
LKLKDKDFTLVANNCVAGTIYEDLGVKYLTPFVGLYILPSEFIELCETFEISMQLPLKEIKQTNFDFPVGSIGQIRIYFMHYKDFDSAHAAWNRRKSRINYDFIGFILVDRDGCTSDDKERFLKLNTSNKVILSSRVLTKMKGIYRLRYYKNHEDIGNILEFKNRISGKRIMYDFKFIRWINEFQKKSELTR